MNSASVKAVPHMNGFEAHFRKVHRSGFEPVCLNGTVQLYPTEPEALVAAYEALNRHIFGDGIVSSGERVGSLRTTADMLFPGKGRRIAVERR